MDDSSPVIKRAVRTYGRPKAPRAEPAFDADTSFGSPTLLLDASSGSVDLDLSDVADFPPNSSPDVSFGSHLGDDGDDDDNDPCTDNILSHLKPFVSIRDRLRQFDEEMDEEENGGAKTGSSGLEANQAIYEPLRSLFGKSPVPERSGTPPLHTLTHLSPLKSTHRSSHTPPSPHEFSPVAGRSPLPLTVPGRKKRLPVALGSDSEQELPQRSSSPHTSPGAFQLHTPPGRSSPTPPTSSEMASRRGKGKGREILSPMPGLDLEQRELSEDERPERKTRSQTKGKAREKRVKAPTKKELQETQKATARLQAQRTVALSRVQQKPLKWNDLMQKIGKGSKPGQPQPVHQISSDPIEPFSPAAPHIGSSRPTPVIHVSSRKSGLRANSPERKPEPSRGHNVSFEISDDDEELPDIQDVFTADQQEMALAQRRKELRDFKLRAVEQQRDSFIRSGIDSGSDLEIEETMDTVVKAEAEERRRSKIHNVKTPVRKRKTQKPSTLPPQQQEALLAAAARPAFVRDARFTKSAKANAKKERLSPGDLNHLLLGWAGTDASEIGEEKEREWVERGGKVVPRPSADERPGERMTAKLAELAAKGLTRAQQHEEDDVEAEEDEEDDDGEWTPAPQPQDDDDSAQNPFVAPDPEYDTEFEDENASAPKRKHRALAVVDSDEENGPIPSAPTGRVLVPDSSLVFHSPPPRLESSDKENVYNDTEAENETDKENDASLMFDRGEDKENTAIASTQSTILQPIFGPGLSSRTSMSSLDEVDLAISPPAVRSPLKPIGGLDDDDDDDPFMSTPAPRSKKAIRSPDFFSPSRRMPDPADDDEAGPSTRNDTAFSLEPAANIKVGFSQFMASGNSSSDFSPAPALGGSPSKTQFSQFVTPAKVGGGFDKLRKAAKGDDLSLTLAPAMQPSLDVTDSTRKKAEAIFDKEQEFVIQDAVEKPAKSSQLFVNQHGFYTQTDPALKTPGNGFSSPAMMSQTPFGRSSPLLRSVYKSSAKARAPLGTIDLDEEPQSLRPARLFRRAHTPEMEEGGYRSSPSPSPSRQKASSSKNAFNVLMQKKPKIPRPKMEKSVFVEGEAEESDEDAIFGFGPKIKGASDDEEDGEDQDATLKELVDDKEMDADTLNEGLVLEKVKEHQEADDAKLQRYHQDAAEGKMRAKRRDRGLGFEDSDTEDEDGDDADRRRRIAKKRKMEGGIEDSLDKLAKHEETLPFVRSYQAGLPDDDLADFAHLQNEDEEVMIPEESQLNEDDDEDEEEEEYQPEMVSAYDLQAELRKVARGETTVKELDPEDLSWMDNDDDMDVEEEPIRIKEVSHQPKRPTRSANADPFDFGVGARIAKPTAGLTQHTKWATKARAEGVSGTGRASAITVTGHAVSTKTKSKLGGGSIVGRGSSSASTSGSRGGKKSGTLAKTSSALSAVSGRRDRFGA